MAHFFFCIFHPLSFERNFFFDRSFHLSPFLDKLIQFTYFVVDSLGYINGKKHKCSSSNAVSCRQSLHDHIAKYMSPHVCNARL